MRPKKNRPAHVAAACCALATLMTGCAQGPSEAEFVQACVTNSSPQMGVTEAMCQCAAREARSNLPPELYRAMVLDMQGKKQESEASLGNPSFAARADFAVKQLEVLGKCMDVKASN